MWLGDGVRTVHVYEDVVKAGVFSLDVELSTLADLEAHIRSSAFSALLGAANVLAANVEISICQPATEFGGDPAGCIRRLREKPIAPPSTCHGD